MKKNLLKKWEIKKDKKIILLPGRLNFLERTRSYLLKHKFVNKELGYEAFYAVILGSDQGRDIYIKKN